MFSERPHTQDLGLERQARLLWVYGWLHWLPRTELVERALQALDIERGEAVREGAAEILAAGTTALCLVIGAFSVAIAARERRRGSPASPFCPRHQTTVWQRTRERSKA